MTRRTRIALQAALLACAAAATLGVQCGGTAPMRLFAPKGDTHTWMPVTFDVDMASTADTQSFQATLNGHDITGWFVLDDQGARIRAVAAHVWDETLGLVLPGPNAFQASVTVGGTPASVSASFTATGDPYADAVVSFVPGTRAGFGQGDLPGVVLGGPFGIDLFNGSLDVLSLGIGGVLTLEFVDNLVVDGPGVDFTVFENAFLGLEPGLVIGDPFSEPAHVSVSQDGVTWYAFPCADDPALDAPWYPGCAGVRPTLANVSDPAAPHASIPTTEAFEDLVGLPALTTPPPAGAGGDSYDLADVGLAWVRFVRLTASSFDAGLCCQNNAGPDIDAVAAVHSE